MRLQLEPLHEYPFVRRAMAQGMLEAHGWVYHMETGELRDTRRDAPPRRR